MLFISIITITDLESDTTFVLLPCEKQTADGCQKRIIREISKALRMISYEWPLMSIGGLDDVFMFNPLSYQIKWWNNWYIQTCIPWKSLDMV